MCARGAGTTWDSFERSHGDVLIGHTGVSMPHTDTHTLRHTTRVNTTSIQLEHITTITAHAEKQTETDFGDRERSFGTLFRDMDRTLASLATCAREDATWFNLIEVDECALFFVAVVICPGGKTV